MTDIRTRRDATENRAALLAAARIELNLDAAASLETIAASAGLSRRAVYGHFASRDDLVRELLVEGVQRVATAIGRSSHPDAVVDLALIASHLWNEVESTRIMALFAVRGPFKGLTADGLQPLRERVLTDVRRGQAAGVIRSDIEAKTLARLIEESALLVLDEATTEQLSPEGGHALAMQIVLSVVGLDWRAANALITATPELTEPHESRER